MRPGGVAVAVHGFALTLAPIFSRISSVLCSQTQPFRGFAFFAKVSLKNKKGTQAE